MVDAAFNLQDGFIMHGASWLMLVAAASVGMLFFANVRGDLPVRELVPNYADGPSRFAMIEGMRVHYRDEGSGPALILIHGTSSSLHTWDGWVERLRAHHRIIRLDLPGFGLTGPAPDGDYRPSRDARVVVSLMSQLGVERADVAGNSLGGRVALMLALDYPDRVRRLVLIDSRGLSGQEPTRIERIIDIPVIGKGVRWVTPRSLVRRTLEESYADPSRISESLVDRYDDLMRREGNRQALIDARDRKSVV